MATATAINPLSQYEGLTGVTDGSHIAPDQEAHVAEVAAELESDLTKVVRADANLTKQLKSIARHLMDLAVSMRGGNGRPVFNFGTAPEVFTAIVGSESDPSPTSVYGRAFAAIEGEDRRRILTRVRAFRDRVFKESYIVDYVLDQHYPSDTEAGQAMRAKIKWDSSPVKAGNPPILAECPKEVGKLIADEYKAAGLEVPEKFGGTAKKDQSKRDADKNKAPAEVLENVAKVLAVGKSESNAVSPAVASFGLYRMLSAFAARLEDPAERSDIPDRPAMLDYLERLANLSPLVLKLAKGDATPADVEKIAALRFDSERDVLPAVATK